MKCLFIHLVENTQPLEGKVGVELLDLPAVGHYNAGGAACGYDPDAVLPELLSGASDQGVECARVAVDETAADGDRKSTRLNSSHANISYAVFCLKKKK